ncbi:MAG: type I restriction-modification system subunit M N-terminal domain-containing protein [Nitrosospira sp.]|nr:type I restriction-modification system subunit M N-terminal domain-containing protein [Nitrosospira sp.]MBN9127617.1 type I restriction-modification system subunit M N-terminal domain-containing protein [Nitrosospira sp.]
MRWIAPTEKDSASISLEKRLWDAADQFRANSGLKAQEYSGPILGLIFLRFAEVRFALQRSRLEAAGASSRRGSRTRRRARSQAGEGTGAAIPPDHARRPAGNGGSGYRAALPRPGVHRQSHGSVDRQGHRCACTAG